jgi:hypothetical protein
MKLSGGDENKYENEDLAETKIKTLVGKNKDGGDERASKIFF